jgi:hypothetical protein
MWVWFADSRRGEAGRKTWCRRHGVRSLQTKHTCSPIDGRQCDVHVRGIAAAHRRPRSHRIAFSRGSLRMCAVCARALVSACACLRRRCLAVREAPYACLVLDSRSSIRFGTQERQALQAAARERQARHSARPKPFVRAPDALLSAQSLAHAQLRQLDAVLAALPPKLYIGGPLLEGADGVRRQRRRRRC